MQTMKNVMPLQYDKYDALFRFQTTNFTVAEVEDAKAVAEPVVVALLSSRHASFPAHKLWQAPVLRLQDQPTSSKRH